MKVDLKDLPYAFLASDAEQFVLEYP